MSSPTQIPAVAVIGTPRSGTSCMAGVLVNLGVHMGHSFQPPTAANPKGFFEALGLKRLLVQNGLRSTPALQRRLHRWISAQRKHAAQHAGIQVVGGKHPQLSLHGSILREAWGPNLLVIRMHRPPDISARSAKTQNWPMRPGVMERFRTGMFQGFDEVPVLDIAYTELVNSPTTHVDMIIQFLSLSVTDAQRDSAIAFIDPKLNRHT